MISGQLLKNGLEEINGRKFWQKMSLDQKGQQLALGRHRSQIQ